MATTETDLGTDRLLRLVNYFVAVVVAYLYLSPLGNIKIGPVKPEVGRAALATGSDGSSLTATPSYFKNLSDSCVALWIQEYLVPLDQLCHGPAVGADLAKKPDGWLDRMGSGLGLPLTDRQDFLASFCPGDNIFSLSDHLNNDDYPMLSRQRCLTHWFNDRILPEPIYSPNVGESYWLCDADWMHEYKGYTYTFQRQLNLAKRSEMLLAQSRS